MKASILDVSEKDCIEMYNKIVSFGLIGLTWYSEDVLLNLVRQGNFYQIKNLDKDTNVLKLYLVGLL